jgi:hypothetical protein
VASKFDLNDATPAAPAGRVNIQWQLDATGNVSAHVPSVAAHQTPWLSDIDADGHDLNDLGIVRLRQVTIGELDPASGLVGFANEEGTLHAKTGIGGNIDLESVGNGRVMISTEATRRIVVHQNGNVGIGPSMNPGYTLDVQGTCNVSGAFTAPLSVQSALFKSSADMVFQVGAGFPERVRITASGKVGIGAANPGYELNIEGHSRIAGALTIQGINVAGPDVATGILLDRSYGEVSDSMDIVFGTGSGMSGNRLGRISGIATGSALSDFVFYAQNGGDGYSNEAMRISGNGTVKVKVSLLAGPGTSRFTAPSDGTDCVTVHGSSPNSYLTLTMSHAAGNGTVGCWDGTYFGGLRFLGIRFILETLRSTNPGAGTKEIWYDAADGNRVKFAA